MYRNGLLIHGSDAFEQNNQQTRYFTNNPSGQLLNGYPGYRAEGLLSNQRKIMVPQKTDKKNNTGLNGYMALGDNSTDSLDGRAWGFVPEHELVGRALFIYYPFTKRWGLSN